MVLDDLHDDLLSDFVHIVAFHTSRPFVRVAVGADSEGWQREMEEKRGAERAGRERRRRERQARNAAQAALALAEHAQKVNHLHITSLMGKLVKPWKGAVCTGLQTPEDDHFSLSVMTMSRNTGRQPSPTTTVLTSLPRILSMQLP